MHQFGERALRQRVALLAAAHNQRRNNGQRKRNAQAHGGALAGARVDLDLAADLLHVGAHHVHAHAAAAYVGDFLGGREARLKDQLQQLALGQQCGAIGREQPALNGLGANPVHIHARAVVGHFNNDVAALLHRAQAQRALGVLAHGLAHIGRLNAVVQRIAHRVCQRVLDGLEQTLVELRLLAFHLQPHPPAQRLREIAHNARHLREHVRHRLHARLHHALAQVGGHHVQTPRKHGHVRIAGGGLQHLVAREHQLAHQIHHPVQQHHIHAQRAFSR